MHPTGPAETVRLINAAREAGDFEAAVRHIAVRSLDQGREATHEDWLGKWRAIVAGVPDFAVTALQSVESGEWVSTRYRIAGTHTGDFFGRPPTGAAFEVSGMDMVRVVDGLLVEHWVYAEPF
ncbi:ester cyclase [Hamadaea tsunoensis]|uniref:ester cyclase n=1 Tax=Hamadaea tsunoensis TaxID=53368 RepID=UPI0004128421|nr:ester cyclase [Hamadaea tsunoensis]